MTGSLTWSGFASGSSTISRGCRSRRGNILGYGLPVAASCPGLLRQWAMSDSKSSEPQRNKCLKLGSIEYSRLSRRQETSTWYSPDGKISKYAWNIDFEFQDSIQQERIMVENEPCWFSREAVFVRIRGHAASATTVTTLESGKGTRIGCWLLLEHAWANCAS